MSLRLNHKIQFIKEEKQQDNTGGYNVVEVVELETWAKIEQLKVQKDIEQAKLLFKKACDGGMKKACEEMANINK